jgi:hypothetical protein
MAAVIHGLISGVLPARCQREAGACGAGAAGSESQPYLEGGIEAADLFGGRLGAARCLRIGFGEDRGTRSLPGWSLPEWSLPDWALLGRRGDGLLGGAGSGDPAYKGAAGSERRPYV